MCTQMQGTHLDKDWYAVRAFLFSTQDLVEQELGDVLWIHQELKKRDPTNAMASSAHTQNWKYLVHRVGAWWEDLGHKLHITRKVAL